MTQINTRMRILTNVSDERDYQDKKWGIAFDDKNTINDWGTYINHYVTNATRMDAGNGEQYKALIKVAALAVAALETLERLGTLPPRHYDVNYKDAVRSADVTTIAA